MAPVNLSLHATSAIAATTVAGTAASAPETGFSFHDLLDIVNPLQHIPVVSTLYRAITGDHIKTFPKIAGDTLFGGLVGFVSSVADTIFEKITGKSVGDTVLAWVEDELKSSNTAVASASPSTAAPVASAPIPLQPAPTDVTPASLDSIVIPGRDALLMALTRKSVDQDIALRAANAYRSTLGVAGTASSAALH
jgi:hypothetical protein